MGILSSLLKELGIIINQHNFLSEAIYLLFEEKLPTYLSPNHEPLGNYVQNELIA